MTDETIYKLRTEGAEIDIDLPTPVEVARELENSFTTEQAEDIAQYVYQPLREVVKGLCLKGVA